MPRKKAAENPCLQNKLNYTNLTHSVCLLPFEGTGGGGLVSVKNSEGPSLTLPA